MKEMWNAAYSGFYSLCVFVFACPHICSTFSTKFLILLAVWGRVLTSWGHFGWSQLQQTVLRLRVELD